MAVPGIKEEELALIKSALLLGFLQKVFERDARILEQSGLLKSPEAYVDLIRGGERRVALVLSEIQGKFRERNIEIERIRQDENGIQADYRCRGYHGKMRILWAGLQREVSTRMRAYLGSGGASAKERAILRNRQPGSGDVSSPASCGKKGTL
ncbi:MULTISPECIES: hypothetical protein [Paenibacillus]|uniref:Uncharacterized protein n=1 Tax=Paenibacillus barengoltzii J12 TaxID=935846 RepID=A0ABY1LTI4_9BACL|nr:MULTISPECIES: hypothetical protein [Paenibacillus]MDU0329924.1 hypothetical protein [Paenibacillus sp. 3LSP]SMF00293.1 hypothetical protein SAMN02744124_00760 [Paenibacillus barengoltzii J12]